MYAARIQGETDDVKLDLTFLTWRQTPGWPGSLRYYHVVVSYIRYYQLVERYHFLIPTTIQTTRTTNPSLDSEGADSELGWMMMMIMVSSSRC